MLQEMGTKFVLSYHIWEWTQHVGGCNSEIMFFCLPCCVKVTTALQTYSDNIASPTYDQKLQNLSGALQDLEKELKEYHSLLLTHPNTTTSKFKTNADF